MHIQSNMIEIVQTINKTLPLHSLWDGFWVHAFKRKTLIISCSFDRTYYRNFDLVFKNVIFYNVPSEWRDTAIHGDNLIRLSTVEEFTQYHPGFDTSGHVVFGIDIHFGQKKYSFFIVGKHVYLNECKAPDNHAGTEYVDLFEEEEFPCRKNRVVT